MGRKTILDKIGSEMIFGSVSYADADYIKKRKMQLAITLRDVLKQKGFSYSKLASLLGKKTPEISKWLSGEHNFTIDSLFQIESVLKSNIISTDNINNAEIARTEKFVTLTAKDIHYDSGGTVAAGEESSQIVAASLSSNNKPDNLYVGGKKVFPQENINKRKVASYSIIGESGSVTKL